MIQPPKNENQRFMRFVMVGLLNTLIDFGLMNLFTQVFKISLVIAQALSFTVAVISAYFLNRIWIYPEAKNGSKREQFPKFVIINLLGLGLRSVLVPLFDKAIASLLNANPIHFKDLPQQFFSHNGALALVLPLTILMNFFLNRAWTFKTKKENSK
ncbi:MAG: GtrA family protein [Anaerolineaceae bacterium]|nr:GtrA family protein [Anaerolineaceae bacterium]